jgi:hypothetical protein
MNDEYKALHKFLFPNKKIEDVMVDMNQFTNSAPPKTETPKSDLLIKEPSKPSEEDMKKPSIPRKQKRLNDRIQTKLTVREERQEKQRLVNKQKRDEKFKKIKEEMKREKEMANFQEDDVTRIKRIIFGDA